MYVCTSTATTRNSTSPHLGSKPHRHCDVVASAVTDSYMYTQNNYRSPCVCIKGKLRCACTWGMWSRGCPRTYPNIFICPDNHPDPSRLVHVHTSCHYIISGLPESCHRCPTTNTHTQRENNVIRFLDVWMGTVQKALIWSQAPPKLHLRWTLPSEKQFDTHSSVICKSILKTAAGFDRNYSSLLACVLSRVFIPTTPLELVKYLSMHDEHVDDVSCSTYTSTYIQVHVYTYIHIYICTVNSLLTLVKCRALWGERSSY